MNSNDKGGPPAVTAPMDGPLGRPRAGGIRGWALSLHWMDGLALAAGALAVLGFAPFEAYPLAVLAPAILFATWLQATPARALWRGWMFGVGLFSGGIYWVYFSMHHHGHMPGPLAAVLTAGFALTLALVPGAAGYLGQRLSPAGPAWRLLLAYPVAWTITEWLRGWLFSGFPWLNLGYSQDEGPLMGLAPLTGVYGVSWAVALSAGALVLAAGKTSGGRAPRRLAAAGLLAALWLGAWGLGQVRWTQPAGEAFQVSLVQGNVPQAAKWDPDQRGAILADYAEAVRRHWDSRLVVLPESALPVFYDSIAEAYLDELVREGRRHGTDLLIGILSRERDTGRYYNSMVALGDGPHFYHKRHLVPFGEYIPLKSLLGGVLDILHVPMSDFSAGAAGQPPLPVAGHAAAISICYEIAFGGEVNDFLPQAAFLVSVSNNSWFGDSSAPHQVLEMARMRARESGRYVLSATNDGITAIVDPRGRVTDRLPQFQAGELTGRVQPRQGATPYAVYGDAPAAGLSGLLLGLLAAGTALGRFRR